MVGVWKRRECGVFKKPRLKLIEINGKVKALWLQKIQQKIYG